MTEEQVYKTLREIYSRVPKEWRENVVTEKPSTPTMIKVIDEALADPNYDPEKKKQLQALKDSGQLDKKQYSEDQTLVKKIDNFVNREINKAVKDGRLPNKKKLAELQAIWKEQKNNLSKN